ncbi:dethiobiotin synthase [Flavihumibacter solisilvae]|uniref:ATP-dependent dethiobiotin synthetase BioD n=1 Tax=Flavihumibacter solisilvae TaxID=1349421 RepID=A0A0C1IWR7_9BACT|nr:dethiobiotin synthase [Flavihumibacter solisilvae]KIC94934.1 dethiobiotin synthase [Flavihumibacter solisilvae]
MSKPIFITGIGTGIGKTLVSAIVTEALQAHYWKPVQAGFADGTDTGWIKANTSESTVVHPEVYKLAMPASPHIASREEGVEIDIDRIVSNKPQSKCPLVVEGAGGLLVPLNDSQFVADLVIALDAAVILVSRNYLGSINHSLLTAEACRVRGIPVIGWIFNDHFGSYENEIAGWTKLPVLASIPFTDHCDRDFVRDQANKIRSSLTHYI